MQIFGTPRSIAQPVTIAFNVNHVLSEQNRSSGSRNPLSAYS
jgi:hypothetical protein